MLLCLCPWWTASFPGSLRKVRGRGDNPRVDSLGKSNILVSLAIFRQGHRERISNHSSWSTAENRHVAHRDRRSSCHGEKLVLLTQSIHTQLEKKIPQRQNYRSIKHYQHSEELPKVQKQKRNSCNWGEKNKTNLLLTSRLALLESCRYEPTTGGGRGIKGLRVHKESNIIYKKKDSMKIVSVGNYIMV